MKILKFSVLSTCNTEQGKPHFASVSVIVFLLISVFSAGCNEKDEKCKLTVVTNPEMAGTVKVSPEELTEYNKGIKLTLSAQGALGYYLKDWSGDINSEDNPLELVMNSDMSVIADFAPGMSESFEGDSASYFVNDHSGRWVLNDTAYVISGGDANIWGYSCYNYNGFSDFELSVDLYRVGGTYEMFGVFFRSQNIDYTKNSYAIGLVSLDEWVFLKFVENEIVVSYAGKSSNIKPGLGVTNNLKIECTGSSIEVIINGVSQGVFPETQFSSGYIGLFINGGRSENNVFIFDNLRVKSTGGSTKGVG